MFYVQGGCIMEFYKPNCNYQNTISFGECILVIHSDDPLNHLDSIKALMKPLELKLNRSQILTGTFHLYHSVDNDNVYKQYFHNAVDTLQPFIPQSILAYYCSLEKHHVQFMSPQTHCNKYYKTGDLIFANFPYVQDDFYLVISKSTKEVCLYGRVTCVYRIIYDLLFMIWDIFPIHGSGIYRNGHIDCFLGNSNSGKSTIVNHLLKQGFGFAADDIILLKDGLIYPVENIIKNRPSENNFAQKNLETVNVHVGEAPIGNVFVVHRFDNKTKSIIPFLQFFPSTAKQSAWWGVLCEDDVDLQKHFDEKTRLSMQAITELLKKSKDVVLNIDALRQTDNDDYLSMFSGY